MQQKTILIVDDDEDVLLLLSTQLTTAGFEIVTAKSGKEALRKFKEEKIHLLILDRLLHDLSGEEIVEKLKMDKQTANIPIILSSAIQPGELLSKVDFFILKPCKLQDLSKSINRPLSKFHLLVKIAFFGIFVPKFFDYVITHALKILTQICTKNANFIKQSEFRKRSNELLF